MAVSSSGQPQSADATFFRNFVLAWAKMRRYQTELIRGHACALRHDHKLNWEHVCVEPSAAEFEIMSQIVKKDPLSALTIISTDQEQYKELGKQQGFDLLCDEAVMVVDLEADGMSLQAARNKDEFTAEAADEKIEDYAVTRLRITQNGEPAAKGDLCVDGDIAIFDRIGTEEAMRRRGLGSLVMRTLGANAMGKGAKKGWLIASADGEQLYTRLGWKTPYRLVAFGRKDVVDEKSI